MEPVNLDHCMHINKSYSCSYKEFYRLVGAGWFVSKGVKDLSSSLTHREKSVEREISQTQEWR